MASAAIPALKIGGSLLGGWLGNKSAKNAVTQSPTEKASFAGTSGTAGTLSGQGGTLAGIGTPALQQSSSYYSKILGGGRGSINSAVQPELNASSDLYRGADKAVTSSMVGPQRDQALAENARAKAGTFSNILGSARPNAAAALTGIGTNTTGQSIGATQGAGSIYSGMLGNTTNARLQGNAQTQQIGSDTGSAIYKILTSGGGGGSKNKGITGGGGSPAAAPGFSMLTGGAGA
jgi:hypothetical protein